LFPRPYETVVGADEPTVFEAACVLREWHPVWKKLYLERDSVKFLAIQKVMCDLLEWRRQMVTGKLTQDQMWDLKVKMTAKIDWGNRRGSLLSPHPLWQLLLDMDLVPRVECAVVDPDMLSPVELYQVHLESVDNIGGPAVSGSTLRRREKAVSRAAQSQQLYLAMRDFSYNPGENLELRFALYDAHDAQFLSENFLVRIAKCGQSNFLTNHFTVFTDVGKPDVDGQVYLVVQVLRTGETFLLVTPRRGLAKGTGGPWPVEVGARPDPHGILPGTILHIAPCLAPRRFRNDNMLSLHRCNESDFHQLHELIIKKMSHKYNMLPGQPNLGLVVTLCSLQGELSQLQQENPVLLKSAIITRKRGFPDVIMPGDVRNDLYLTLDRGEFEKGGKSTGKNIEATVLLVAADGQLLQGCLSSGTGEEPCSEFRSLVLYHNNNPRWSDTVKVSIPMEMFDGSHIRIEFRHCSARDKDRRLLGFSFLPLMDEQGTIIRNGSHELYVYKADDSWQKALEAAQYRGLATGPRSGDGLVPGSQGAGAGRSPREALHVTTLLCSTKLTQNGALLSLLKWKVHPDRIENALNNVIKLDGEEIVKFLQDILDALFSMFSTGDGNSTACSGLVFKTLVYILSLLESPKFEHFKPVMDAYITSHFAAALVYKAESMPIKGSTYGCVIPIVESRLSFVCVPGATGPLSCRATGDPNEEAFWGDLHELFCSFEKMLSLEGDSKVLPMQVSLVHSLSGMYEQLVQVLPLQGVARLVRLSLSWLAPRPHLDLAQARLRCIQRTAKGPVFAVGETRRELLEAFVGPLREQLCLGLELRLCTEVLGDLLSALHRGGPGQDLPVLALLEPLVNTLCELDADSPVMLTLWAPPQGWLMSCLLSLLRLMEESHYLALWDRLRREEGSLRGFLAHTVALLHGVLLQDIFPRDWMVMRTVANHVALGALQEFSQVLTSDFLEPFDQELWLQYLTLAVAFLTQPSLQLESFSSVKRERMLERYGDMRVLMGFQILALWNKLGCHKACFVPAMVGPFLKMTLVRETELRKATLPIFFDMMDCEQAARGNFQQVESELIDKLDILVSESSGDDEYRQLFHTILLEKVRCNEPVWKENGVSFISSITRLLERLLDYRNVVEGAENRDKRMSCTVNLLKFYRSEIQRQEMYVRYVYKLCDLHLPAENFTEAAFTLKLHADLLSWSGDPLPADERHREQPQWQRKEALYLRILKCSLACVPSLQCWEEGIPLCKELAELYEKRLFNYEKLSSILKMQAQFLDNILTQLRPEPEYFRVGFYGLGFPVFLRNKVFVYRGLEYEKVVAFTQRMQSQFPQAQLLTKNAPPDIGILGSDEQHLQICSVKPLPERRPEFDGREVPDKVLNYYLVNDVRMFQFDRPIHKEPIDKDNEFKSLWIERTTLETEERLPGVLPWQAVVHQRLQEVPPLVHACESVEAMNQELRRLVALFSREPSRGIAPLSMRLAGVIEAAVNGGIAKYQEAFFGPRFALDHPEQAPHITRLKALILDKVHILEGGLSLHGRLAPPEVLPLQRRLVDRFVIMKQSV
ncbi:dedicator of cytokinesis protein, putative, partial [Ixodes scapularis]